MHVRITNSSVTFSSRRCSFSLKSTICKSMLGTNYSMMKSMLGSTVQSFRMFTMPILDMVVAPS